MIQSCSYSHALPMSLHKNDVIIDAQERVFMSVENEAVIVHALSCPLLDL